MDDRLRQVAASLPHKVTLAACNVDDPDSVDLCRAVRLANVPYVAVYVNGEFHGGVVGLREPPELRALLLDWIRSPEPTRRWWHFW